jgi:hypothetical protein
MVVGFVVLGTNIFVLLFDLREQSAITRNSIFSIALDVGGMFFSATLICLISLAQVVGNVMKNGMDTDKRLASFIRKPKIQT